MPRLARGQEGGRSSGLRSCLLGERLLRREVTSDHTTSCKGQGSPRQTPSPDNTRGQPRRQTCLPPPQTAPNVRSRSENCGQAPERLAGSRESCVSGCFYETHPNRVFMLERSPPELSRWLPRGRGHSRPRTRLRLQRGLGRAAWGSPASPCARPGSGDNDVHLVGSNEMKDVEVVRDNPPLQGSCCHLSAPGDARKATLPSVRLGLGAAAGCPLTPGSPPSSRPNAPGLSFWPQHLRQDHVVLHTRQRVRTPWLTVGIASVRESL